MPRLSFYLLALTAALAVVEAKESVKWGEYRKKGVSQAYYCPEQVGEQKWECNDKFCGGENPSKKGHCSLVILQGQNKVPNQWAMNPPLYCKCGPKSGHGVKPPAIIPFPPPPPGFFPPPAGIPHPKNKDSCPEDFTDTKCEDCKPKSGWCTEGPRAGCPCRDKCPADDSDDVPSCSSETCEGEDGKCTTGHYVDCKCKEKCPDNKKKYLKCGEDKCKSDDRKTCKEGDYKGCKCLQGVSIIVNTNPKFKPAIKHMKDFQDIYDNLDKYAPKADTKCPSDYSNAVAVDKTKAYELGENFCSGLDQAKKSSKELKYKDATFNFEYKPGKTCYTDCKDTIHKMVCSGYDDHSIQPKGKATFKCGAEYSFKIEAKKKSGNDDDKPSDEEDVLAAKRTCRKPDHSSSPPNIHSEEQAKYVSKFCNEYVGQKLIDGTKGYQFNYLDEKENVWYSFEAAWDKGPSCKSSSTVLDFQYPLGKDHKNNCESLMRWTYKLCGDNGGIGGSYNLGGCVKYSYHGHKK